MHPLRSIDADPSRAGFARVDPLPGPIVASPPTAGAGAGVGMGAFWAWSGHELGGGLFEPEGPSFGAAGWDRLVDAAGRLARDIDDLGGTLLVRPHHAHLVSDVPSCRRLVRDLPGVRLLLDPVSMLAPSMLRDADDHLRRIVEELGPSGAAVVLCGCMGGGDALRPCPFGDGLVSPSLLLGALERTGGGLARLVEAADEESLSAQRSAAVRSAPPAASR